MKKQKEMKIMYWKKNFSFFKNQNWYSPKLNHHLIISISWNMIFQSCIHNIQKSKCQIIFDKPAKICWISNVLFMITYKTASFYEFWFFKKLTFFSPKHNLHFFYEYLDFALYGWNYFVTLLKYVLYWALLRVMQGFVGKIWSK